MKKRVLISCVLLSLVMVLTGILAIGASAAESTVTMTAVKGGTAIGNNVVTIASADELYMLRDYVAGGADTAGVTFRLTANIALPNTTITTTTEAKNKNNYSNSSDIGTEANPFKGIFDGNGKTISNLIIAKNTYSSPSALGEEDMDARGVFAHTDGATILNLTVAASGLRHELTNAGALIGYAKNTTVKNCASTGDLTTTGLAAHISRVQENIGGLVGTADGGEYFLCKSSVRLTGLENVGGLFGVAKGNVRITGCDSLGSVGYSTQKGGTNPTNFGGIAGKADGALIYSCLVKATVYAKTTADAAFAGGIAGEVSGTTVVANCVVDVAATSGATGVTFDPVIAKGSATVENVYSAGASKIKNVVTFDGSYTLASQVTVNSKKTNNLFAAFNLYAESRKSTYGATSAILLKKSNTETYARAAYCTSHTRASGSALCEETTCSSCYIPLAAEKQHTRLSTAKACKEGVKCQYCNKVEMAPTASHTLPAGAIACEEGNICTVCNDVMPAGRHLCYSQADCINDQICELCDEIVTPALGHSWDGGQDCANAEKCAVCKVANPDKPATGLHTPDREAPDCLNPVRCAVCTRIMKGEDGKFMQALGHDESGAEPTCGTGKSCSRCHTILADGSWEHTVDWTSATVVREASAERPGILRATCSVCNETVEQSVKYVAPDDGSDDGAAGDGNASAGLPTGALIGIIAGGVVVVGGGAAAAVVVVKKNKNTDSAE